MPMTNRRTLLAGAAALPALGGLPFRSARAQAANTIRIGVMNDQSGPYRDIAGPNGVIMALGIDTKRPGCCMCMAVQTCRD